MRWPTERCAGQHPGSAWWWQRELARWWRRAQHLATARRWRRALTLAGALLAVVAVVAAVRVSGTATTLGAVRAAASHPLAAAGALGAFGSAFLLRAWAWQRSAPGLSLGHAWAALHVALAGNHLLPLRLGEPLRVVSVVRRAGLPPAQATASTVVLRSADLLTLIGWGAAVGWRTSGLWWVAAPVGVAAAAAWWWLGRRQVRRPGLDALLLTAAAWPLEAVVVWQAARWVGVELSPELALGATAAAVVGQVAAVAPGGFGTYEAAGTAALVAAGLGAPTAVAVLLLAHATKTVYALVVGAAAAVVPAPTLWGYLRLPRRPVGATADPPAIATADPGSADGQPARAAVDRPPTGATAHRPAPYAPVVLVLPAHDEAATVADVVRRLPGEVAGHPTHCIVVDDDSTDDTAAAAAAAGAEVVRHPTNRGLGAAVRTGLEAALAHRPAAVAFCDADGEYAPEELGRLVAPILEGRADYVVGSRFRGHIHHMRPHRRVGNLVLTAALRWIARTPLTDGQSGYRALSPEAAAAAEIIHDYNYAQVLTLDLLGKGFRYAEVPISYRYRTAGRSFVRLLRYLRAVAPAVWRELNAPPRTASHAEHQASAATSGR